MQKMSKIMDDMLDMKADVKDFEKVQADMATKANTKDLEQLQATISKDLKEATSRLEAKVRYQPGF